MSRHRAVRNLDYNEELYDDDDGNVFDEMEDMSEEDRERMQAGIEAVKAALGAGAGINDQEIRESLWYYYFDEAATVAWLKSDVETHKLNPKDASYEHEDQLVLNAHHRSGPPPRPRPAAAAGASARPSPPTLSSLRSGGGARANGLAGLKSLGSSGARQGGLPKPAQSPSIVGKALSALRTSSVPSSKPSLSGQASGRLLSQMAALPGLRPDRASATPLLKNFAGRQVPDLRSTASPDGGAGRRGIGAVGKNQQRNSTLNAQGLASTVTTLYAQPSSLASFILNDAGSSSMGTWEAALATLQELKHEIAGLLEANQQQYVETSNQDREGADSRGGVAQSGRVATNFLGGDVSFVSMLVGKGAGNAKKFGFNTPSPDDTVLAAQSSAGGSSAAAPKKPGKKAPAAAKGVAGKVDAAARDMGALAIGEAAGPTDTPKAGRIDVAAEHARAQAQRASLSLVVVGHVDAGKSTLMGHLLYALGQVSERTVRRFEREAEQLGKGSFAYAWVLDETAEERARGVTMDVATSSFATAHRQFTLLDAPGHRDFVPNMISGASRADAAVLVVDAAPGAFEAGFDGGGQTREHAQLVRALGVRQVVVAVNKLDAVDWSAARYAEVTGRLRAFLQGCGFARDDVRFVPVGGLGGTNLARRADRGSALAAWYRDGDEPGPSLAELLDTLAAPARAVDAAFRLAAADVFRSGSGVSVGGRVVQGSVQAGDAVAVVPGGARGVVRAVTAAAAAHDWAAAGDDVVVLVQGVDALQVPAGAVLCAPARPVAAVSSFEAQIAVFDAASPITNGFPVLVHVQSASVAGSVRRIVETFDARTGAVARRRPRLIRRGATARVEIAVDAPLCLELFADVRELGRVTLRRGGETVAAGIVTRLGL